MSPTPCAPSPHLRPAIVRTFLLVASLLALAAFGSMACEDNGIGRPCDVSADAGLKQAVYNPQALECPSRICLKPIVQEGAIAAGVKDPSDKYTVLPTGPYCSATCSKDSDCDGQKRDGSSKTDMRCRTGYTCGVVFEVGVFCCKKLCLCKDFYSGNLLTPITCVKDTSGNTGCLEQP